MSDKKGFTVSDNAKTTGATEREARQAEHNARNDAERSGEITRTGNNNPGTASKPYFNNTGRKSGQ